MGLSTMQCTFGMLEVIDYFDFNKSRVCSLLWDASKAFERVNYYKLFAEILKHNRCALLLRLLLFMYSRQSLRVNWGNTVSSEFTVLNVVKPGGMISPILFASYTDGLLNRLEETGVGCHMGSRFTGALAYADDITLLATCKSAISVIVSICERCAFKFDIHFNGSKRKLFCYAMFKGRFSNGTGHFTHLIHFINKCLSSSNFIVNVISHIAISYPLFIAGKNYRSVLDANSDYNNNQMVTSW